MGFLAGGELVFGEMEDDRFLGTAETMARGPAMRSVWSAGLRFAHLDALRVTPFEWADRLPQ